MRRYVYPLFLAALALGGCKGKEEPYKELPKDEKQVSTQALADQEGRQYLYIRSVGQAPRYAANIMGFVQGDPKVVTLAKTANGIQARQVDRDLIGLDRPTRYDSEINKAPVLTIPGEYIDYKCAENQYEECTNSEQVNSDADLDWSEKRYFVPDFADVKIAELSIDDLFTFGSCVRETESPQLVREPGWKGYDMDLKEGVINFEVKRTYQASSSCLNEFYQTSLDDLSFTTTEFISLVALDRLSSPDYQAVPYAQYADSTFGFFKTSMDYADVNDTYGTDGWVRTYLNRFNPAKKTVTYYLSNNFYEPKNKAFLDAAVESVAGINIQNRLFKTGVPEIKLEKAGNRRHGDLRYNNITLFDEPLDNGLAGYGPSAANPLTGEIVSARVNQYSANLRQAAAYYYRRVRLDYNRGRLDAKSAEKLTGVAYPYKPAEPQENSTSDSSVVSNEGAYSEALVESQPLLEKEKLTLPNKPEDNSFQALADFDQETRDFWSENSVMHVDNIFDEGGGYRQLPSGLKDHAVDWRNPDLWVDGAIGQELKAFYKLPQNLQQDISIKLAAQAFVGTLTHELGHNLGLRHNFAGSRDKDNLFTQEQLGAQQQAFAQAGFSDLVANAEFSSQMDYNPNRFVSTFQPYDMAALRFGYAREVEVDKTVQEIIPATEEGGEPETRTQVIKTFTSLKGLDQQRRDELRQNIIDGETRFGALNKLVSQSDIKLRDYAYCTDGNVSLNSNCNRSDAGSNNEEIQDYFIERYKDGYQVRNLRDNRQNFLENDVVYYALARKRNFDEIRQFIEDLDRIEMLFGLPVGTIASWCKPGEDGQPSSKWYCRYQGAVDKASILFLVLAGEDDAVVRVDYSFKGSDTVALSSTYALADLLQKYSKNLSKLSIKLPEDILERLAQGDRSVDAAIGELALKSKILKKYWDLLDVKVKGYGGRFLNGLKSPIKNPNHPYSNERDLLGVWPDKLLAVRSLVSRVTPRRTSNLSHRALVDSPAVAGAFKAILYRATMGPKSLTFGDQTLYKNPYASEAGDYMPGYSDFSELKIESLAYGETLLANYFGFDTVDGKPKGKSNLLQMMLRQVVKGSRDSDVEGERKARVWREFVGIHRDGSDLDSLKTVSLNGRKYGVTRENLLALELLKRLEAIDSWMSTNKQAVAAASAKEEKDRTDQETALVDAEEAFRVQAERDRLVLTYLPVLD